MNSPKIFKNSNTSQEQGNNIFVYPTPITNSSGRESLDGISLMEGDKIAVITTETTKKKKGYFKRIRRLGTYFSQLLKRISTVYSKNDQNSTIKDTTTVTKNSHTCWKNRLKFERRKPNSVRVEGQIQPPRHIWCFRPLGTAAAFKSSPNRNLNWTEFEKKNQIELSRQLSLLNHRNPETQDSFEIQDKHIFNNSVVVTVMLKERIAFVLDPEWSQPITYKIIVKPKYHWYQEIYMRHKYRQMLRNQHRALKAQHFPEM